ncbi:MAG: hypothetical protein ACHQ6V_15235 [Myxococcota bacterium]
MSWFPSITFLALAIACTSSPSDLDVRGSHWRWEYEDPESGYESSGSLHLRSDGRFSRGGETCHRGRCIADDSIGFLHWGWFRDGDRICFVESKEEVRSRRVSDRDAQCTLEIDRSGPSPRLVMLSPRGDDLAVRIPLTRED